MTAHATPLDQQKSEAFAERMLAILNGAGLSLMCSIGHRAGLFDTMSQMGPATSEEIAKRAGLQERYVREWLGAMTTGRIVEYDPQAKTYVLPPEHAAWLTRAAGSDNIASPMQWVAVMGGVEDRIVECFQNGGGVPYEAYQRFHEVMASESELTTVAALVDSILPLVDGLPQRLERGIDVLDVGCGRGKALMTMAEAHPNSRFTGYDLCEDAIEPARQEAKQRRLTNVRFEARDLATLDETDAYDLITAFDIVHDQKDPARVLRNIHRALRPDGVFLCQDIAGSSYVEKNLDAPLAPFIYTISCMHCMSVSLAQGGAGLGAAWGEECAERMFREAGFESVEKSRLDHDILNTYYIVRPAAESARV